MITLLIEAAFVLVFLRALVLYLRHRDRLQRDVMLVFAAMAVLFVLEIVKRVFGEPPTAVGWVAVVLLLAQPYLTLRLVATLRPVRRWVVWTALVAYVVTTVPLLALLPVPPLPVLLAVVAVFALTEVVAAAYLGREAVRRSGAPRVRLTLAAAATVLFAVAIMVSSAGSVNPDARHAAQLWANGIALGSALAYVAAFTPPPWLRRLWAGAAAFRVSQRLVRGPATETPQDTWRRYAGMVRDVTSADAAIVLLPADDDEIEQVAAAGRVPAEPVEATSDDLDVLLAMRQPVVLRQRLAPLPLFDYARRAGARYVMVVPLSVPALGRGALVVLSRWRSLFADDDVRLLGDLGAQAAMLAGRGAARAEQERLATELADSEAAARAASQAKSDFLANMSHELRTPLNAIIGFSELMRGEEAVQERRLVPVEWIEHVYASGRHLLGLVNGVLDLSKIEAGRLELRAEQFDLADLVDDALTTLAPVAGGAGVRLTADVPPIEVRADRTRLRQVLDNLLSNAIKFTPAGGKVSVAAGELGAEVGISVTDTGIGIAPADQERVFEEFQQVGDPEAQRAGTGLGLALTRRLVQAHGGRVELWSEPGQGSRFTVYLPTVARVDSLRPAAGRSRATVLLIEDEPSAARLLTTYLESAGYAVALATSGEEGLAAAERAVARDEPLDAIMLDVLLPGIDGWEVLRRLKRDERLRQIPVFMATIIDERDVGLATGAVDYFVKPIDRHLLLTRLAEELTPRAEHRQATHVLAIDADPGTLEVIAGSLRRIGFDVTATASGREGLRLARQGHFDLIITDLAMPDVDGFALIKALNGDPAARRLPLLVLAGQNLTETDKADLNGKVLGILPKGHGLHEALHEWLAQHPERLHGAALTEEHVR